MINVLVKVFVSLGVLFVLIIAFCLLVPMLCIIVGFDWAKDLSKVFYVLTKPDSRFDEKTGYER